jgi:hypothetical protein
MNRELHVGAGRWAVSVLITGPRTEVRFTSDPVIARGTDLAFPEPRCERRRPRSGARDNNADRLRATL